MALGSLGPTPSTLGFRRPSRSPLVSGQTRLAGPPEGPSLLSAAAGVWPARAPQPAGEGQVHSWPYSYRRLVSCRLSLLRDSVSPRRTKPSNPSVTLLTPSRRRQKADLGQDWQSVDQSQELGCALADQQLGAEGSWTRLKGAFLSLRTSRDFHFSGTIGWTTEIESYAHCLIGFLIGLLEEKAVHVHEFPRCSLVDCVGLPERGRRRGSSNRRLAALPWGWGLAAGSSLWAQRAPVALYGALSSQRYLQSSDKVDRGGIWKPPRWEMAEENQGGLAWSRALVPALAGEGEQGARRAREEAGSCKGNRELTSPCRPFTRSLTLLPHFSCETFSESRSLAFEPIALTGNSLRALLFCFGLFAYFREPHSSPFSHVILKSLRQGKHLNIFHT